MHPPCDHHVLRFAHTPAYLGSLSEDAYAHLSRLSMAGYPPISPFEQDGSAEAIWRSAVFPSKQITIQDQLSRSSWNGGVPVNRLPPEILLEIFQALKTMTEDDSEMWMIPGNYVSWTAFSHVCRTWRDVICNSAQLWRDIHVKDQLQWVELCLSSSFSTADASFTVPHHAKDAPEMDASATRDCDRM
ncbi:hypothetical protein OH76DRAFT_1420505 [Lentinus brumalis]|uniref:F-box domain-containing protein n=1 Tax=Lentinus brumalis TaxID=2498619 RepID=A0A371D088_9APHY|nr:hypothetical protein OH76DRAFT_1420505 [Polyporus brumalis]